MSTQNPRDKRKESVAQLRRRRPRAPWRWGGFELGQIRKGWEIRLRIRSDRIFPVPLVTANNSDPAVDRDNQPSSTSWAKTPVEISNALTMPDEYLTVRPNSCILGHHHTSLSPVEDSSLLGLWPFSHCMVRGIAFCTLITCSPDDVQLRRLPQSLQSCRSPPFPSTAALRPD